MAIDGNGVEYIIRLLDDTICWIDAADDQLSVVLNDKS